MLLAYKSQFLEPFYLLEKSEFQLHSKNNKRLPVGSKP